MVWDRKSVRLRKVTGTVYNKTLEDEIPIRLCYVLGANLPGGWKNLPMSGQKDQVDDLLMDEHQVLPSASNSPRRPRTRSHAQFVVRVHRGGKRVKTGTR